MEGQFHADYASCSTMQGTSEGVPGLDPNGSGQTWPLANDVEQLLGNNAEPDPLFFVESWTLGVPAAVQNLQQRRLGQAERERQNRAFRELDNLGSLFFVQEREWFVERFDSAPAAVNSGRQDAVRPPRPAQTVAAHMDNQAPEDWQAFPWECEASSGATEPMTTRSACQLLGVSTASPRELIKAAYRRMVNQWHPDRHESRTEEVRRLANEKMTAINEAYSLLRGGLLREPA